MPPSPNRPRPNLLPSPSLGRFALVWLVILLVGPLSAAPVVVTLRNGDRLTGEVKSESAERLVLKTALTGTIKIPKSEIAKREPVPAAVAAPSPAVAVKPAAPAAPAKPAPTAPVIPPAVAGTAAAAALPETNAPALSLGQRVRTWLPGWMVPYTTNWHGSLQMGMDLGMGTSDRQTYYGNATATHSYNRVRNNVEYHTAYGILNDRQSANRMNGRIKTDYDFGTKRKIYVYNTGGMGYDEVRRVDLEFDEGVGLGYKLVQRPKFNVNTELGGQYQNINFSTAKDRAYMSIRAAETLSWQVSPKLKIDQKLAFMPNLESLSDYRIRFELSASYPLFKRVTVSFNAIEMFDSAPPTGVDQNDLTLQSTVGISF